MFMIFNFGPQVMLLKPEYMLKMFQRDFFQPLEFFIIIVLSRSLQQVKSYAIAYLLKHIETNNLDPIHQCFSQKTALLKLFQ